MIVSAKDGDRGFLFDVNGRQIEGTVYWANLETGECRFMGTHGMKDDTHQTFPAPLTFRATRSRKEVLLSRNEFREEIRKSSVRAQGIPKEKSD